MIILLPDPWDYYERAQPLYMTGTGHAVSSETDADDPAEQVRRIAEEVTGKEFAPPKRRMGFL